VCVLARKENKKKKKKKKNQGKQKTAPCFYPPHPALKIFFFSRLVKSKQKKIRFKKQNSNNHAFFIWPSTLRVLTQGLLLLSLYFNSP
jgi:hypothetical protein